MVFLILPVMLFPWKGFHLGQTYRLSSPPSWYSFQGKDSIRDRLMVSLFLLPEAVSMAKDSIWDRPMVSLLFLCNVVSIERVPSQGRLTVSPLLLSDLFPWKEFHLGQTYGLSSSPFWSCFRGKDQGLTYHPSPLLSICSPYAVESGHHCPQQHKQLGSHLPFTGQ